ncbi:hypothetical protein INS49_015344 [Diaporthe citri]|uniref:uncharacterized protein n=1 Tax=Diaporthe citri TaxID=83186 RepID=UPI001C826716|nr:uncharacterized protein INS49_015344 [Diaporthe citri]KAG6355959.1 hypothetical protein INS49_015344 [Diaporthe citri]
MRSGSHLTHSPLGRRYFASRKTARPSKRAEALTALARERYNRDKHSSIGIGPYWAGIAALYAALIVVSWGGTTYFWLTHSEKTPVTGRRRFAYYSVPQSSSEPLSEQVFSKIEEFQSLIRPQSEKVRQVFMDIAVAAGVDDREWKVYIIPDPEANAAVSDEMSMVIIYSGMLKHIKAKDDLAVVLAHELAHVIAKHDDERHSRKIMEYYYGIPYTPAGIVGALSLCAAMVAIEFVVGGILLIPFAIGEAMRLSAYRKQEKEADAIGLLLMTEAGYNPYAARRVWASVKAEEDQDFAAAEARAKQTSISKATGTSAIVRRIPEHERTHPLVSNTI